MYIKKSLLWAAALSMLLASGASFSAPVPRHPDGRPAVAPPAKVFRKVLPEIKAKTKLVVLLPSELPPGVVDGEIHLVEGRAGGAKYEVSLYFDPDIGDAGMAGYFTAEAGGKHETWEGKRVELSGGWAGYFTERLCGGSCAPSWVEWEQNGVLYTIQWKLQVPTMREEELIMVRLANSSIRGGPR